MPLALNRQEIAVRSRGLKATVGKNPPSHFYGLVQSVQIM